MAKAKNHAIAGQNDGTADLYFELVRKFPLRPIRSDAELDAAIAVVDCLIDQEDLSTDEADYLEVLSDLVEKYETEQHPMPDVSDADMLRHLIESRATTLSAIAAATGVAVSTISEILAGKRRLNRRHIGAFADYFHVSSAVFIGA